MIKNSKTLSHGVKAEDTRLKRIVALKFLPPSIMAIPTGREEKTRFIHEAQAAAALNHPNICTHLWAENYKRKLASVFDLQDEVSQAIAQALQVTLTPAKISALASAPPKNTEAHEYYLKGNYQLNSKYALSTQESDFQAALDLFNKALKSDSNYALAYIGLASAYGFNYLFSGFSDPKALELHLRNAEIAVELDPNLAEAHAMLVSAYIKPPNPDYDRAYKGLETALRLNPNLAQANFSAGLFMQYLGLSHQALNYFYRTIELDPLWLRSYHVSALCLMQLGRFEEAAAQLQKLAEIEPGAEGIYRFGAWLAILTKKYDQADSLIAKAERINPRLIELDKALLFAARGEKEKALALSKRSEVYALLGMKDEAIRSLKSYGDEHGKESLYLDLLNFPPFADLRDDPRFMALVEKEKKKYEEVLRKYGDLGVLGEE
jgi:tetratricopeptide (TPR) repeat protein